MLQARSWSRAARLNAAPLSPAPPLSGRRDRLLLAGGAVALAVALGGYIANVIASPPHVVLGLFDLRLYLAAGQVARHAPAALYGWQFQPGFRFTYPPFAAAVFAGLGWLPWAVVSDLWPVLSVLALGLTVLCTARAVGWTGERALAAAAALTAVTFWTEPVQRTLHLGQIDLLLMGLVVWDLCQPGRRWWQGAGIGLAAGLKLVPLIFLIYLVLTGRLRQAAVGLAAFAATVSIGWMIVPAASAQFWLGGKFLDASRVGFAGSSTNQSLLALMTRIGGAQPAGTAWPTVALAVGAAGLAIAVRCDRAGAPVAGWLACAITGLLISPVSWDHHWVWIVPGFVLLGKAATTARGRGRAACWLALAVAAVLFGAWPAGWPPPPSLPWGLIWIGFGSPDSGISWLTGNLYIGVGLLALIGLALLSGRLGERLHPTHEPGAAG